MGRTLYFGSSCYSRTNPCNLITLHGPIRENGELHQPIRESRIVKWRLIRLLARLTSTGWRRGPSYVHRWGLAVTHVKSVPKVDCSDLEEEETPLGFPASSLSSWYMLVFSQLEFAYWSGRILFRSAGVGPCSMLLTRLMVDFGDNYVIFAWSWNPHCCKACCDYYKFISIIKTANFPVSLTSLDHCYLVEEVLIRVWCGTVAWL